MSEEEHRAPNLLAAARRAEIVDALKERGSVRVSELSRYFNVSEMTVRRDIEILSERGEAQKVHGGARATREATAKEATFDASFTQQIAEKQAIAREAVKYAQPGMAIGLSAGTTTYALAEELREVRGLTIITNSVPIADIFHRRRSRDPSASSVLLTGGERTASDSLVGPLALSSLQQFNLDLLFLGVHGFDVRAGYTTTSLLESQVDREFVRASKDVVVVADHTKWAAVGMCSIAPLDAARAIVTDDHIPAPARTALDGRVAELVIAEAYDDEI